MGDRWCTHLLKLTDCGLLRGRQAEGEAGGGEHRHWWSPRKCMHIVGQPVCSSRLHRVPRPLTTSHQPDSKPLVVDSHHPPGITLPGDDNNHGSAATLDILCLQALSKRIHYGKFVAEAKFR